MRWLTGLISSVSLLSSIDDLACGGGIETLRPLGDSGLKLDLSVYAMLLLSSKSTSNSLNLQLLASESARLTLPGLRTKDLLLKQGLVLPSSNLDKLFLRVNGLARPKLTVDLVSSSGLKSRRVDARLGAL